MIRITPAQVVTAIGALAFLFVQVMVLEIRQAAMERAKSAARVAALEAQVAALSARIDGLEVRFVNLGAYVLDVPPPHRPHSSDSPPPSEL